MHRVKKDQSVDGRARLSHALTGIIVASLTGPAVAWGADPQRQWAVGEQQGLIFSGLKMVGALALILGLMLLCLHFLKRWRSGVSRRCPESQVQILDVRMLAPKKSVALIEVAGERLLLGVGAETVTLLSRIDSHPQSVSAELEEAGPGFAKTLLHTLRRRPQGDCEAAVASANPVQSHRGPVGTRTDGDTEKQQLSMLK